MITGDTLYISGLTAVIRGWSCILQSKQWKCFPHCSWLRLHWRRRRRIKIRQKMWWELLLSRVIPSKYFSLSSQKKKAKNKQPTSILANVASLLRWVSTCVSQVGQLTAGAAAYLPESFSLVREPLISSLTVEASAPHARPWFIVKQLVNTVWLQAKSGWVQLSRKFVSLLVKAVYWINCNSSQCWA